MSEGNRKLKSYTGIYTPKLKTMTDNDQSYTECNKNT